jgi:hypothetical protein
MKLLAILAALGFVSPAFASSHADEHHGDAMEAHGDAMEGHGDAMEAHADAPAKDVKHKKAPKGKKKKAKKEAAAE